MLLTINPVPGEYYNIGGKFYLSVKDMLTHLVNKSTFTGKIIIETDPNRIRPIDADLQVPNTEKFCKHTDWKPKINFETTMNDLLNYWRDNTSSKMRYINR